MCPLKRSGFSLGVSKSVEHLDRCRIARALAWHRPGASKAEKHLYRVWTVWTLGFRQPDDGYGASMSAEHLGLVSDDRAALAPLLRGSAGHR